MSFCSFQHLPAHATFCTRGWQHVSWFSLSFGSIPLALRPRSYEARFDYLPWGPSCTCDARGQSLFLSLYLQPSPFGILGLSRWHPFLKRFLCHPLALCVSFFFPGFPLSQTATFFLHQHQLVINFESGFPLLLVAV